MGVHYPKKLCPMLDSVLVYWLIGIILLFVIIGILLLFAGPGGLDVSLNTMEFLTAIDVLIGALLTGALVLLYRQQKNILEEQKDLKVAELSGDLRVDSIEPNEDQLDLWLSNMSGSEVSDIKLYTETFPKLVDGASFSAWGEPLNRADTDNQQLRRSNALAPHEQEIKFTSSPYVHEDDGDSQMKHDLQFTIRRLRDKYGQDEIDLRMWVEGTDQVGNSLRDKVLRMDRHLDFDRLSNEPEMREILKHSGAANIDDSESEYGGRLENQT